ncbi:MAG TPA: DNA-processing protein DprA [Vicinamibacterales bacterium]|nr:DNA-processing protein DprA [Vicinamibacterales bacterium]
MTPTDAAAIAILGTRDRRLLAAVMRAATNRSTAEDHDALPPREANESLLMWACRSRATKTDRNGWRDESQRFSDAAAAQIARGDAIGAVAVPLFDPRFPALLASIPDPPPCLWIRGEAQALSRPGIALVGSRAATPYGLAMASRLAADLAAAGMTIISGLARGVDSAAHAAALSVGGKTIGVLGCGIDRIYPAEHRELAANMQHAGAVISEFPPGVPPLPHHFPLRNRLISGLSFAVVVVEAPEKSGSLITASAALEQGRDVMVVPGQVTGGRNRGGHLLIRDGAKVVESADDILQDLGPERCAEAAVERSVQLGQLPERVEFTVDDVVGQTGELPNVVLGRLLELELSGRIQRVGGGRFVRVLP